MPPGRAAAKPDTSISGSDVPNPTTTATVALSVGHNLLSDTNGLASGSLLFGVADGPVTNTSGSTDTVIDLNLVARPLHGSDFNSDGDTDGDDLSPTNCLGVRFSIG